MKPILFNTEMARAILDGRKTTTRRVIKPQCKRNFIGTDFRKLPMECRMVDIETQEIIRPPIPPYNPGDILYVRETWCNVNRAEFEPDYYYYADSLDAEDYDPSEWKWRPSIHMPKEAARIFLRVTDVKAERLQDITEDGAKAEGIYKPGFPFGYSWNEHVMNTWTDARGAFSGLWNSTVKKSDIDRYGWAANSWVWVISFERCEKPND